MKTVLKTIAASMIIVGTAAFSNSAVAQVETQDRDVTEQQQQQQDQYDQQDRVELEIDELPEQVSEALSTDYDEMDASKAYRMVDPTTREVVYEVHLLKEDGTTEKKKFDEQGEEIEALEPNEIEGIE